jgi:hypothetical protein
MTLTSFWWLMYNNMLADCLEEPTPAQEDHPPSSHPPTLWTPSSHDMTQNHMISHMTLNNYKIYTIH